MILYIYLIKATELAHQPYDSYDGFVVIASSEEEARGLCPVGCEGAETWGNPKYSTCKRIGTSDLDEKQNVLSSFNAG